SGGGLRSGFRAERSPRGEAGRGAVQLVRLWRHQRHIGVPPSLMRGTRDSGTGTRAEAARSPGVAQTPICREISGAHDLLPLAAAHPQRYPGLLESAVQGAHARWDILFAFPMETLSLHADGRVRDAAGEDCGARFLDVLDENWRKFAPAHSSQDLPFTGGWLLYLGYELAAEVEPGLRLPFDARAQMPIALALRCPAAILVDRSQARTLLVAEDAHHAGLLDALQRDLDLARNDPALPEALPHPQEICEDDPAHFLSGVARIHDYLRNGDTFQVNLSRQ